MFMECSIKDGHLRHRRQHLLDNPYTLQVGRVMGRSKDRVVLDCRFHLRSHKCGLAICGTTVNDAVANHSDLRRLIDDFSCPTPDGFQHVLDDTFSGTCRQAFMPGLTASRANLNVCGSLMSGPISISFPQWHGWLGWQRAIYCVQAALLAASASM